MTQFMSKRSADGYTLIEMLVVLTIIGLIMASAPMVISAGWPGAEARAAAYDIANALRQARVSAIAKGKPSLFLIDTAANTYSVNSAERAHRLPSWVSVEALVANAATYERSIELQFFPDGSSSGGTIRVRSGASEHRIVAHPITGRISIDE